MPVVHRLPAYLLNGIAVALGIGIIQLLVVATAGPQAGALAMSGAVCASLADVPNTVHRTAQRVPAAALLGWLAALVVALLQAHPVALGLAVAVIVFVAMMTMAWGARAGAVSFAPILALVFTMATPPGKVPLATLAVWHAAGALAYVGWSLLAASVLQRRYRTLALCEALRATAALLRARAGLLTDPGQAADAVAIRNWIQGEAVLAEHLQGARDFVFTAPDSARARRDSAILLRAIDLRDMLLASRLDLELLGNDASARRLLDRAAEGLNQIASQLDAAASTLRSDAPPVAPADDDADRWFEHVSLAADDSRTRLLPLIASRLRGLAADAARIHALLRGEPAGRRFAACCRSWRQRAAAGRSAGHRCAAMAAAAPADDAARRAADPSRCRRHLHRKRGLKAPLRVGAGMSTIA